MRLDELEPRLVHAAVFWDGGGGDNLWSNPLNWSLNFVPRQIDDVTINIPGAQRLVVADSGVIRVKSLTLDETLVVNSGVSLSVLGPFNLTQGGDLRINGLVNWAEGTWRSDKPARINAGGMLNIGSTLTPESGSVTLGTSLTNQGRLAWRGGDVLLETGSTLTNQTGKAFDIASPGALAAPAGGSPGGLVVNDGLMRRGGLAHTNTRIGVSLTNNDRLFVMRGELRAPRNTQADSVVLFTNNARVALLQSGSSLLVEMRSTHNNAVYTGPGSLSVRRPTNLSQARVTFTGEVYFGAGSSIIDLGGSSARRINVGPGPVTLGGKALFMGTDFELHGSLTVTGSIEATAPHFYGSGDLIIESTLRTVGNALFTGRVTVQPGAWLQILSAGNRSPARFLDRLDLIGRATLVQGTISLGQNSTLDIADGARLDGLQGLDVVGDGSIVNRGLMIHSAGSKAIAAPLDNRGTLEVVSGLLSLGTSVEQLVTLAGSDALMLTGGTWIVRGTLNIPTGPGRWGISTMGTNSTVELLGSGAFFRGISAGSIEQHNLLTEMRGTLVIGAGLTTFDTNPAGGALINRGTIRKVGAGTTSLQMPIIQQTTPATKPTIDVSAGNLSIPGSLTNTGTLSVGASGRLSVDGDLTNAGGGTIMAAITGGSFGRITLSGNLFLQGGTLRASFSGSGFAPGQSWSVIQASARNGTFAAFERVGLPAGLNAVPQYTPTSVAVRVPGS